MAVSMRDKNLSYKDAYLKKCFLIFVCIEASVSET